MTARPFIKMHGLGNDFVVVDARAEPFALTDALAQAIADRRTGVGCDQLLILEPPTNGSADVFMRIRNHDGGEVGACGNGTRCVAALVMAETGQDHLTIETKRGLLQANAAGPGRVTVDMGEALTDWRDIPLSEERDTLHLGIENGPLADPVGVNMGNPHAVFFVEDVEALPLDALGPDLEHHPLFPERANIGAAEIIGPDRLRLRVWERGVGLTQACGSGACAAAVAAARRGLTGRKVEVVLDGGPLELEWREDGHVEMTGAVATAFTGELTL
ncbi:diaminopimelate epimerase [Pelagibius litoralis]|uniref:Diaminopimelate epimerase n=1 Tax=Pelagibius litoralis TaxID=374515 RepID=A0A967CBB0_9PROT|nr:diaminopimelate epimerase [Pelagibius litoralis]NIA68218.1 diaminopimelate epimerase [Pelagibius litoralis]